MAHAYDSDVENAAYLIARSIDRLGNGDAATPMGGLEALGEHLGAKFQQIADALPGDLSGAETTLQDVAAALRNISLSMGQIGPIEITVTFPGDVVRALKKLAGMD